MIGTIIGTIMGFTIITMAGTTVAGTGIGEVIGMHLFSGARLDGDSAITLHPGETATRTIIRTMLSRLFPRCFPMIIRSPF